MREAPQDQRAEEALLGAMLLARQPIEEASTRLRPADFYKPAHVHIYDAILALYEAGVKVDPITVADSLDRSGVLDACGGAAGLVALQADTPALSNVARYALMVEHNAVCRRMIGAAGEIAEIGYDRPEDPYKALDFAQQMLLDIRGDRGAGSLRGVREMLEETLDRLERLYESGAVLTGIPTGFLDFDEMTSGLQPGAVTIIAGRPGMGKALALDTPLPTPTGWTAMGDVRVGDRLLDERGASCVVTYATPVQADRQCYRVTFDDHSTLVADADHQWFVYDRLAWKAKRERHYGLVAGGCERPYRRFRHPRVVTTRQMIEEGLTAGYDGRPNWYLPLTEPLDLPDADLPVDPYVLGCWLGDGASTGAQVTIGDQDLGHFTGEFEMAGYTLTWRYAIQYAVAPVAGSGWQGYQGPIRVLARELQRVGLLRGVRKHVPDIYLRASAKQRLALLQGLMDTDGSVEMTGRTELTLTNRELLEQARELMLSLGEKPNRIARRAIRLPDGRRAEAWRLSVWPRNELFRMQRKAQRLAGATRRPHHGRITRRHIVSVEPVPSVPVRCLTVDSPSHLYLAGREMIPTHNTAMALNIAAHAAIRDGRTFLFHELEGSHQEIMGRLLASEARIDSTRIRNGKLVPRDWDRVEEAVGRLADADLWIDDSASASVLDIRAQARRLQFQRGRLDVVVVDHVGLVGDDSVKEYERVTATSRGLKVLAKDLNCHVIALAQLNRGVEQRSDKRPTMADLRSSGSLEQDADTVVFLYRDEVYDRQSADLGVAEVIVAKQRDGPTGLFRLAYLGQYTRFANMARQ